ncbi:MAG TPA: metal ABC transporter substrate-binding protein [Micromonosporaceae bacterium]|nr:metal ABC transporter substrate-binding protein [Micromonosporaceae bacterium]
MVIRTHLIAVFLATAAVAGAGGCTGGADDGAAGGGKVDVVAGFYPLQFVAEQVGGDAVAVTNLAKPGAEPHDMELTPHLVARIADADLVVYLNGFQPAVDESVALQAREASFDAAAVEPLLDAAAEGGHEGEHPGDAQAGSPASSPAGTGGKDPHVWLDPVRLATIADRLADRLSGVDPAHAAGYRARAGNLRARLEQLHREYADGLRSCARRQLVVSHAAFGYLARRYRLEQIALSGISPEDEPPPQRLAEVAEQAREHGATTIFFETLVSPKVAETIAREVRAATAVLDPVEGLPAGSTGDYFSVMRRNLATLRPALGCP